MQTTTTAAKDLTIGDRILIGRTAHTVLRAAPLAEAGLVQLTLSRYVESKHDYVSADKYMSADKPVKLIMP